MSSFFQELKRRNVFRVGIAYGFVSWIIIQVIETVSDPLGLPDWTEAFFIVLVLAGLPLVLLFSWAFELTPDGLKKTAEVDADASVTATTGKKLNYAIIGILVIALGYSMWDRQGLVEQAEQTATETADAESGTASIAVLPFVNMSADEDQEYFSDGISEELLNLLAKIPDLRVPARTSSFQFKGQSVDIAEVAKQLNVKHVLEGSVRRADVRVRVTAQLIEADTGYHLWSETYDRELTDIFAIQDEISAAIVAALSKTLGLNVDVPHVTAAANPEAYNAYLLGQHQIKKRTKLDIESAIANYQQAIDIDPDYAPAHAGLGLGWYLLTASGATYGTLTLEESLAKALPHLERAIELDPDLPEALGAYGLTLDAQLKFEEAVTYYQQALALNPSLTDVRNWYSQALGSLGQTEEALRELEKAYEMDPLSILTLTNYANQLQIRRQYDKLEPVLERLGQIDPAGAASLQVNIDIGRGQAAKGVTGLLRVVDSDSSEVQVRSYAAYSLWNLELNDAALNMWPYPDNLFPLLSNTDDVDESLRLTLQNYEENPNRPGVLEGVAFAQYFAGNKEEGLRVAAEFLESMDESIRPQLNANILFALDAMERGDEKTALERIGPVEALIDGALESGVDNASVHLGKALFSQLRGKTDLAFEHIEKAAFSGIMRPGNLAFFYSLTGWDEMPEFVDVQNRHREYMRAQRAELLATACSPNGFESWQPSAAECGRAPAPN